MSNRSKFILFPMAAVFVLSAAASSQAAPMSFNDVREKIYSAPMTSLPAISGISPLGLLRALAMVSGALVDRIKGTLWNSEDFKNPGPKLLHPMGVCADATWEIYNSSAATGLLSTGTQVKAIVRFSAADEQTVYSPTKKRTFGIAVKLFPSANDSAEAETRNLFFLDQNGLNGGLRSRYLVGDSGENIYYQNSALGGGAAVQLLVGFFKKFDSNPNWRPLYPYTETNADGSAVASPVTPQAIRLVPRTTTLSAHAAEDFRDEILSYRANEIRFDIVIPAQKAPFTESQVIGGLMVGQPVISQVCDEELHFHHHPTR